MKPDFMKFDERSKTASNISAGFAAVAGASLLAGGYGLAGAFAASSVVAHVVAKISDNKAAAAFLKLPASAHPAPKGVY